MAKASCCSEPNRDRHASILAALVAERPLFVAFVRGRVKNAALAEDIVQSAFARASERVDQIASADSAKAWFFRMLKNAMVDDKRRRDARDRVTDAFSEQQPVAIEPLERAPRVCQCVSRLASELKCNYVDALEAVELDETSVKDFAEQTGISAGNAAVRVFRAREALKRSVIATCGSCAEKGGCFDCSCAAPET